MPPLISNRNSLWLLALLWADGCQAWVVPPASSSSSSPTTTTLTAKRARGFRTATASSSSAKGLAKKGGKPKTTPASEATLALVSESKSIQDVLNPRYRDPAVLADLKARLRAGEVVILQDAFVPELAEAMHAVLSATDHWDHNEHYQADGYHYRHFNIYDQNDFPPLCQDLRRHIFESNATRTFMTDLTGRDCTAATVSGAPSYYGAGDHSLPHTDHIGQRTVAYVWHLSKDWQPEWGGALYWAQEPLANAFHHASFNSLVLFSVTPHSVR